MDNTDTAGEKSCSVDKCNAEGLYPAAFHLARRIVTDLRGKKLERLSDRIRASGPYVSQGVTLPPAEAGYIVVDAGDGFGRYRVWFERLDAEELGGKP